MQRIENLILRSLVHNEAYSRKVSPFIEPEYFHDSSERILFEQIVKYISKYNSRPSKEALGIEIEKLNNLSEMEVQSIRDMLKSFDDVSGTDNWMIDSTETWCKDQAVYNALMESVSIVNGGEDNKKSKDSIPNILSNALAVSFDTHVGHDYIEDASERYDFYTRMENKIPFDLEMLNKITKGGLTKKTLNIILAGTGAGKSLAMCHMAGSFLMQGQSVLYITAEMSEEKIAERIDANLLNTKIQDIDQLGKKKFLGKIDKISQKVQGSLIIREYPTAQAHSGHFRACLNELKLKKNFIPDVIFIDYLNICASSRFKSGSNVNSYTIVKSIAEELRGLAVEFNVPVVSATQTTRGGYGNSDVDITDTSESWGLPATTDLMLALISTEELEALNQIMFKQLKNRYNDVTFYKRFIVGIDRSKMRLYDCEQSAQDDIIDSGGEDKSSNPTKDKFAKLTF